MPSLQDRPAITTPMQWIGKTILWCVVWWVLAIAIFAVLAFTSWLIGEWASTNIMTPFIYLVITFVITFIGNSIMGASLNFMYGESYYDLGQIIVKPFIMNIILFFILAPTYFIVGGNFTMLYFLIVFHISFSAFVSFSIVELIANPNYSVVSLIGHTIWFAASIFLIIVIYNIQESMIVSAAPVIVYWSMMFLWNAWGMLYMKIREGWNDFLYTPSLSEVYVDLSEDDEEVTVSMW